jgi:hypothetical protein
VVCSNTEKRVSQHAPCHDVAGVRQRDRTKRHDALTSNAGHVPRALLNAAVVHCCWLKTSMAMKELEFWRRKAYIRNKITMKRHFYRFRPIAVLFLLETQVYSSNRPRIEFFLSPLFLASSSSAPCRETRLLPVCFVYRSIQPDN